MMGETMAPETARARPSIFPLRREGRGGRSRVWGRFRGKGARSERLGPTPHPGLRPQGKGRRARAATFCLALGAVALVPASFASADAPCDATVNRAALHAVNRIPVIGQTTVLGRPFTIDRGVLRVEVDVFGPQSQVYAVDVTIDSACRVLATSTRLESESESPR